MRSECIEELIRGRREIEFAYQNKMYSITYYNDNREKYISFCEYYKKPIDVKNATELLEIRINGKSLKAIFSRLSDSEVSIF